MHATRSRIVEQTVVDHSARRGNGAGGHACRESVVDGAIYSEGMDVAILRGPFAPSEIDAYLDDAAIPMRVAAVGPTGWPLVVSLWFIRHGNEILAATRPTSTLVDFLTAEPRCGFEIAGDEPPYRGVRGRAEVIVDENAGGPVLESLLVKYLGGTSSPLASKLLTRAADEVCLRLRPASLISWDYSSRMSDSIESAT
jgi:nitroimidazol reductase NimA-like FMN-containing flavoprotein (pyridoxamine 5'-phosphate oxidase superfamily)